MKRLRHMVLVSLASALLLSGCYNAHLLNGNSAGTPSAAYQNTWNDNAVAGLMNLTGAIFLDQVCPSGWASIHVHRSIVNALVMSITGNIYSPQSVTIFCKTGAAFNAVKDSDGRVVYLSKPFDGRELRQRLARQ